mmetsp:Transcript_11124/g.18019  ORF Transcript_11124/g.18019 Transcript_11124/m.18019 type:complete len:83 (-) Transcript_11124:395-643(-)
MKTTAELYQALLYRAFNQTRYSRELLEFNPEVNVGPPLLLSSLLGGGVPADNLRAEEEPPCCESESELEVELELEEELELKV